VIVNRQIMRNDNKNYAIRIQKSIYIIINVIYFIDKPLWHYSFTTVEIIIFIILFYKTIHIRFFIIIFSSRYILYIFNIELDIPTDG